MVGSPFWMPPEMIQCKPHGYAADIWSFAICLIEMADKRPPNRKARIKVTRLPRFFLARRLAWEPRQYIEIFN